MSLRKHLRDNHSEVDAGPLNDVLFILLMFFLLVSTLANPNVVKVNNPKGKRATRVNQNIVVSITKDQTVYIGKQLTYRPFNDSLLTRRVGCNGNYINHPAGISE